MHVLKVLRNKGILLEVVVNLFWFPVYYATREWLENIIEPLLLYTNNDQTLVNSLPGRLNKDIGVGGLDCHVITTDYTAVSSEYTCNPYVCNTLVHVMYSRVSRQYAHTIQ